MQFTAKWSGPIYIRLQNGPLSRQSVIQILFRYKLVYMVCGSIGNISCGENAQYRSQ